MNLAPKLFGSLMKIVFRNVYGTLTQNNIRVFKK